MVHEGIPKVINSLDRLTGPDTLGVEKNLYDQQPFSIVLASAEADTKLGLLEIRTKERNAVLWGMDEELGQ